MERVHFERLRDVLVCLGGLSNVIYVTSAIGSSIYSTHDLRVAVAPATITFLQYISFCLPAGFLLGAILSKENASYWILGILASPVLFIVVGFIQLMTQTPIFMNYATTGDGRTFLLAQDPGLGNDFSWSIWRPSDRAGFIWARETNQMNYSEDGRFISNARLVATEDGRRLLVQRGGIWTDCFEAKASLQYCDLPRRDWHDALEAPNAWIGNSDDIAELTGMPAGTPNPGRPN